MLLYLHPSFSLNARFRFMSAIHSRLIEEDLMMVQKSGIVFRFRLENGAPICRPFRGILITQSHQIASRRHRVTPAI